MNPLRILHVLGTGQPEGSSAVRIVSAMATGPGAARFKMHACFLEDGGPLADHLEGRGVSVSVAPWRHGLRDPGGIWRLSALLRAHRFAIVHQHYGGKALRWMVRLMQDSRIVVHLHSRILEKQGGTSLLDFDVRAADVVVATSPAVASRVTFTPVYVVYPGIPVGPHPPLSSRTSPGEKLIVGTAARLVPCKGIIPLIRAMSLLKATFPGVSLEIAGSGPEESALKEEVHKLNLSDCISFLGWQSDLAPALDRWHVFVLPSIEDASPIAMMEAMAAGLPIVSTRVGGIPEVVEDGISGWLVPPNDPVALKASLARLLTDPSERHRMGLAAWTRAREKFTQESMVSAIEKIYEDLLANRRQPHSALPKVSV